MLRRTAVAALLCALLTPSFVIRAQQQRAQATIAPTLQQPQAQPTPTPDPNDPLEKIKDEGMNRSQVMQTLSYLSDVIGARLTASPNAKRANEWTRDQMTKWGLQNAHLEAWGPFGRGWSLKRFSAEVVEPQGFPVIAYPKAWSPGTQGPLTADVVYIDAKDEAELRAKYAGKLKGMIVLTGPMREVQAHFTAQGTRHDEKSLLALADAPDPATVPPRRFQQNPDAIAAARFNALKLQFYTNEGAALLVDPGRGDGGTLFVQSATVPQPPAPPGAPAFGPGAPRRFSSYDKDAPKFLPQMVLAAEHYNRIMRMLQAGEHVKMAVNLDVQYHDQDLMSYNTVAEIPGSDLKDEVVMLGGHMDSWHGGTGATDNGAGVAVAMEAARIIKAAGLQPRRTIRVALWTGEEEGLLGSAAYVKQHFGELVAPSPTPTPTPGLTEATPAAAPAPRPAPSKLVAQPDYEKFDAYFNLDNGTGKIRGVYLQGNNAVAPLFRQWLQPFRTMGAQTLSLSNTGGTDHLSFDRIGLPGFQFIQDEIEYDTRTHHSNMDVFDRVQADDMKQAATIMAAFVYQTAMRDEKLPRKPAPAR
jgi:hypothetical protein